MIKDMDLKNINFDKIILHGRCHDGITSGIILHQLFTAYAKKSGIIMPYIEFVMHKSTEHKQPACKSLWCDIVPEYNTDDWVATKSIVLDHHKSAANVVEKFGQTHSHFEPQTPGYSGAGIAFDFAIEFAKQNNLTLNDKFFELKELARIVGIIDTFQENDPDFEYAAQTASAINFYGFERLKTQTKLTTYQNEVGEIMQTSRKESALKVAESIKVINFEQYKIATFSNNGGIADFVSYYLRNNNADVDFVFGYTVSLEGHLNVSLRSVKTGVLEFAKRFNGGGHDKAAGFQLQADIHNKILEILK